MTQRRRDGRRVCGRDDVDRRRPFSAKREEERTDAGTVKSNRCCSQLKHNYPDSEEIESQFANLVALKYGLKYLCVYVNANVLK